MIEVTDCSVSDNWKTIEGFESYEINKNGVVRNKISKRLNSGTVNHNGYIKHRLFKTENGERVFKDVLTHVLVAKYFVENPEGKPFVHHKDENKSNPASYNLEWTDAKENANKGNRNYKISKGGYPVCEYDLEGNYIRTWLSCNVVGKVYNISPRTVYDAMVGETKTAYGRQWRLYSETKEMPIKPIKLPLWREKMIQKKILSGEYIYDYKVPLEYLYLEMEVDIFNTLQAVQTLEEIIEFSALNAHDKKRLVDVKNYLEKAGL